MYKVEYRRFGEGEWVTLCRCVVDTLIEAEIIAEAKIRQYLGNGYAIMMGQYLSMYKIQLFNRYYGHLRITKV